MDTIACRSLLRLGTALAVILAATPARAAESDSGDTAWILTSTALGRTP